MLYEGERDVKTAECLHKRQETYHSILSVISHFDSHIDINMFFYVLNLLNNKDNTTFFTFTK